MYAIRSYYGEVGARERLLELAEHRGGKRLEAVCRRRARRWRLGGVLAGDVGAAARLLLGVELLVITSYSIHYTKLYDDLAEEWPEAAELMCAPVLE